MIKSKTCSVCGNVFYKTKFIANDNWEKRHQCSRLCWRQSISVEVNKEQRYCKCCNTELIQHPRESNGRFNKRVYCSRECMYKQWALDQQGVKKQKKNDFSLLRFFAEQELAVNFTQVSLAFPRMTQEILKSKLDDLITKKLLYCDNGEYQISDEGEDLIANSKGRKKPKNQSMELAKQPYILQVLEFMKEPHTRKEVMEKFGPEKNSTLIDLLKYKIVTVVGFVDSYDKKGRLRKVYAYQATGKPYFTQNTKRFVCNTNTQTY